MTPQRLSLSGPTYQIVVIEDNAPDVYLIEEALRQENLQFRVLHLEDGEQALCFVRRESPYEQEPAPDLILLDLNLPKADGETVLEAISQQQYLAAVPVVIWSSARFFRHRDSVPAARVARFITKPSSLDEFFKIGAILRSIVADSRP